MRVVGAELPRLRGFRLEIGIADHLIEVRRRDETIKELAEIRRAKALPVRRAKANTLDDACVDRRLRGERGPKD
jgi:hypothetical protein